MKSERSILERFTREQRRQFLREARALGKFIDAQVRLGIVKGGERVNFVVESAVGRPVRATLVSESGDAERAIKVFESAVQGDELIKDRVEVPEPDDRDSPADAGPREHAEGLARKRKRRADAKKLKAKKAPSSKFVAKDLTVGGDRERRVARQIAGAKREAPIVPAREAIASFHEAYEGTPVESAAEWLAGTIEAGRVWREAIDPGAPGMDGDGRDHADEETGEPREGPLSKDDGTVNYRLAPDAARSCGECRYFDELAGCLIVAGMIRRIDTCDRFEAEDEGAQEVDEYEETGPASGEISDLMHEDESDDDEGDDAETNDDDAEED
jgi:hypothetical protein